MPKQVKPLTDRAITAALKQAKAAFGADETTKRTSLCDGNGLYLRIERAATGADPLARWEYVRRQGKTCPWPVNLGLGAYPGVSLAEARRKAANAADLIRQGINPKEARRQEREERAQAVKATARPTAGSFAEVAERFIRENEQSWERKNPRRSAKARGLVKNHLAPVFGAKSVAAIDVEDAIAVAQRIVDLGLSRDLVRKCGDLCKGVLIYAQSIGLRDPNAPFPFDMKNGLYAVRVRPLLDRLKPEEHRAALRPEEAPAFFADLTMRSPSTGRDALIFTMLTTLRASAVVGAEWDEVDWCEPMLVIPEERRKTKGKGAFNCYLSSYAVTLLRSRPAFSDSPLIFSETGERPIVRETMKHLIVRMNEDRCAQGLREWRDYDARPDIHGRCRNIDPHGVSRATFKTWASEDMHGNDERFSFPAVEMVLDHSEERAKRDRYGGAYDRSKLKQRRLEVVEAWGRFLVTGKYPDEPDGRPCEGWRRICEAARAYGGRNGQK